MWRSLQQPDAPAGPALRSGACLLPHNAALGKHDSGLLKRRQSASEAAEAKQFNEASRRGRGHGTQQTQRWRQKVHTDLHSCCCLMCGRSFCALLVSSDSGGLRLVIGSKHTLIVSALTSVIVPLLTHGGPLGCFFFFLRLIVHAVHVAA